MRRNVRRVLLFCPVIVITLFSILAAPLPAQDTAEAWLQQAREYRKEGFAGLAARAYSNVIELDPKNIEAYYSRGRAFLRLDLRDRAAADFDKTIQLDDTFADGYYWRGIMYDEAGKTNKAIAQFSQAIRVNDRNVEAYLARGNSYRKKGKLERDIGDFDRVVALAPEFHLGYILRGHVFHSRKNYTKAVEDYLKALRIRPKHLRTLNNIADAYLKSGKPETGLHYLATAFKVSPELPTLYMTLGEIFETQQRFADALEAYRRCRELALEKKGNKALIKKAEKKIDLMEARLARN